MPDVKDVIKGLEEMLEDSKYNDSVNWNPWADTETLEDAIALLKAQEPADAIPVEWLREKMRGYASALKSTELKALVTVMQMWQKEQEAR